MNLDHVEGLVRQELEAKHAAREAALLQSRTLVRTCANAIRAVHRQEWETARGLLDEARASCLALRQALQDHPDLYYAGYVQDAEKEYVEASVTYATVRGERLPTPADLGVSAAVYLNGLGEAVGELRRYLLDRLRLDELVEGEVLLSHMDDIYSLLVTVDYPDALTGGLRRTTDTVRSILEKTRGDLTLAVRQRRLQAALARLEGRLGP